MNRTGVRRAESSYSMTASLKHTKTNGMTKKNTHAQLVCGQDDVPRNLCCRCILDPRSIEEVQPWTNIFPRSYRYEKASPSSTRKKTLCEYLGFFNFTNGAILSGARTTHTVAEHSKPLQSNVTISTKHTQTASGGKQQQKTKTIFQERLATQRCLGICQGLSTYVSEDGDGLGQDEAVSVSQQATPVQSPRSSAV